MVWNEDFVMSIKHTEQSKVHTRLPFMLACSLLLILSSGSFSPADAKVKVVGCPASIRSALVAWAPDSPLIGCEHTRGGDFLGNAAAEKLVLLTSYYGEETGDIPAQILVLRGAGTKWKVVAVGMYGTEGNAGDRIVSVERGQARVSTRYGTHVCSYDGGPNLFCT